MLLEHKQYYSTCSKLYNLDRYKEMQAITFVS